MALRKWNWEQEDWPQFRYDQKKVDPLEADFLLQGGVLSGTVKHVGDEDKDLLVVGLITNEAMKTSEIEGEVLDRESVQSSIRRQFGFPTDGRRVPPAEQGIAEMMTSLYRHFEEKALVRMFREEPDGFKGGMSAEKYIRITGASCATATRDLQDLVEKEALTRTGALKGTRYHLPSVSLSSDSLRSLRPLRETRLL